MILLPDETADVLVVGAGAAGAASAWRLSQHGLRVLCLEQGGWPEDTPASDPLWERRRLADWNPNPNIRRASADYPVEDDASPIRPLMWNGVGGSTVMWSAHMPRMHPSDFRARTLDGVGADWPLSYAELAPYYALNERMMGVSGVAGDPAYPAGDAPRLPPVRLLPGEHRVVAAFERLGWHWWPSDVGINTMRHGPGRGACVGCGPCELGCHVRARASADVVYWPAALASGARLISGARVAEVTTDADGRATGAIWIGRDGGRRAARARAVILAANGIGTPRILLLSASGRFPNGLANSSGLVGRRLMLHPLARVTGVFADDLGSYRGNTPGGLASHEFYEARKERGFVRGVKLQVFRGFGPALTALAGVAAPLPWGTAHRRRFAEVFGRTLSVSVCSDDLPEPSNRVTLAEAAVDSDGLPGARMTYAVSADCRAALDFGIARSDQLLRMAGAQETVALPLLRDAGFHLMGTAGMGADPADSVADGFGRAHDVPNLFVADGAAFVTAAAVNPTHTIQALALRQADWIAGNARDLPDPH
ncbi:MAG: GMC family oxidoreductase [Acetobacteraceae bacterium]|nr:GMC family oxidoreductase [Acetobacteraceae bacterium]